MSKIHLRELTEADINDDYCLWYKNDDNHLKYYTGSRRKFNKDTLLADYHEGIKSKKWYYYLIIDEEDNIIGNVKIGPLDYNNKTSDVVCLIGNRKFLGKGIASKAIALATKLAFDQFDIRRVHGGMYAKNTASIRAYMRAGWYVEATMKGFYLSDGVSEDRICVACLNPAYFCED